jgi:hypothetical protein
MGYYAVTEREDNGRGQASLLVGPHILESVVGVDVVERPSCLQRWAFL